MLLNPPVLDSKFFANMLQAQHNYNKMGDQQSMKLLLNYYCDCVHYFELKQQSISMYFKNKIKQLAKQIKQFGNAQQAQRNKQKMNKKIIRAMQQQNIQQEIKKSAQKQIKVNQAVNKIIEGQFQNLQKRRQKKRSMIKCKSMTMSFGSIDTSPDAKYMNNLKQIFGQNMELNFNLDDPE